MSEDETRVLAGNTPAPKGSAQQPEGRIGAYRLVRPLGQGGMGEVWLAERADDAYSKQVAIKFISGFQGNREAIDWFRRERQALARLEHPHIARLLDGGETSDGRPYLVMEYVDGVPIDAWVEGRPLEAVLDLFLQVCSAIEHAHRALIVHRDIKPANVLVSADGQSRLLDFGIAKEVDPLADTAERTTTQAYTLHFASPEQIEGGVITVASDIYSLGALLYRLLSGRVPHAGTSSAIAQLQAIQTTQPQKPSRVVLDNHSLSEFERRRLSRRLHGDLDDIVLKCLRREPELRYGSARELIDDIERYRRHEPVLARKGSAAYRASRYLRRHWLALGAAAAVLLTLAGGLYATHLQAQEAERQRALAQKRFDLSRALVNEVLFDFQDRIADVPGTIEARRHLVGRAKQYLNKVAEDAQDDPGLLVDISLAERRLGDIAGNPEVPNLGDSPGARRQYERALELARRAQKLKPADPDTRSAVAGALHSLGSYFYWNDDLAQAEKLYAQELPMLQELAKTRKSDDMVRRIASATLGLGDVYYWSSKLELALRTYDQACAPIFASKSTEIGMLDAKAVCHSRRADALAWLERYPEAEKAIAASVAIYKPMYAANPDRLDRAHGYSISLNKQGEIYSWQQKFDQAFAAFSESLRIVERQYAADPTDLRSARNLAVARNKRGDAYMETKRFAEALADYEVALAIFRKLHAGDPSQSEHERDVGISHHRIGIVHVLAGNPAKAVPWFDEELVIMRRRWQAAPTKAWSRRDLAVALEDRVEAPASPAQLCAWRREIRDLLAALKADKAATPADIEELASVEVKLKSCLPPAG